MDIKDFAKFMEAKRGEFETLMRRTMPVSVGRVAKDHFDDSFRKGGFLNGGFHPWKPARRLSSGGSSAASKYGTLLSGRKRLSQATNYVAGSYRVKVANKTHYAPVHNWGKGSIWISSIGEARRQLPKLRRNTISIRQSVNVRILTLH